MTWEAARDKSETWGKPAAPAPVKRRFDLTKYLTPEDDAALEVFVDAGGCGEGGGSRSSSFSGSLPSRTNSSSDDDDDDSNRPVPTSTGPTLEQQVRRQCWLARWRVSDFHAEQRAVLQARECRMEQRIRFATLRRQEREHHKQQQAHAAAAAAQHSTPAAPTVTASSSYEKQRLQARGLTQQERQARQRDLMRQQHSLYMQRAYEQREQQRLMQEAREARRRQEEEQDAEGQHRVCRLHAQSVLGMGAATQLLLSEERREERQAEYERQLKQRQQQARRDKLLQRLKQQQQQTAQLGWGAVLACFGSGAECSQLQEELELQLAAEEAAAAGETEASTGSGRKARRSSKKQAECSFAAPCAPLGCVKEGDEATSLLRLKQWDAVAEMNTKLRDMQQQLRHSASKRRAASAAAAATASKQQGGSSSSSGGGQAAGGKAVEGLLSRSSKKLMQMLGSLSDRSLSGRSRPASNAA